MTGPTGCATCDDQRPALPVLADDVRDLHRAMHDLGRSLLELVAGSRLVRWLDARLATPIPPVS